MPLPSFSEDIEKNIIRHIKYRGTIRTGEIIVDNGDGTYDVKIALSDMVYPSIETIHYEMVFAVGEIAVLTFEYGSKENPKIIGHGKKIAQVPVEVEVDYSGTARVETLDAYLILGTSVYLEGRIHLGEAGNCTRRGFKYGTTTAYGSDTHTDGSYGDGSYAIQITRLTGITTYHFQAYIIDADGDEQVGGDKTFTTGIVIYNLISSDPGTELIYIHSGITSIISSSFISPGNFHTPMGLTFDGINLISGDETTELIYVHSGVTPTITDSFASPSTQVYGLAYDGSNLISLDNDAVRIYVHSGVSSTITDSFASPSGHPAGLTYDGSNLISGDYGTESIYVHLGVTSAISGSFASPDDNITELAYGESNLISCDSGANRIYVHSGVSSTITDSFASPGEFISALTVELI